MKKLIASKHFHLYFLMACGCVGGCSSRVDVVTHEMAEIDNSPAIPVPPLPPYVPVQTFSYSAQQLRSPFMPPSLARDISHMGDKSVKPDSRRPKQFLEQFPLEELIMKGTIKAQNGKVFALIAAPKGGIVRVETGNFLGLNDGRIIAISPTELDLVEIIPNGLNGYVERPRSLLLSGVGK